MHVCIASPNVPPSFAGAGRRAWRHATALAGVGAEVTVLTATPNARSSSIFEVVVQGRGEWRTGKQRGKVVTNIVTSASTALGCARWLSRASVDVVHVISSGSWGLMVAAAGVALGVPTILESTLVGSDDAVSLGQGAFGGIKKAVLRSVDAYVSISPRLHCLALQAGLDARRCHVIGNDVDVARFRRVSEPEKGVLRAQLGLDDLEYWFVTVGAVRPRKGIDAIVEAFGTVAAGSPKVGLVVVGPLEKDAETVEYAMMLKKRVRDRGLEGRIRFAGQQEDVAAWLSASDAFVFASREEGFGTALIEAMAVGLPIAAVKIPQVTDYIVGEARVGAVVESERELGDAMRRVMMREVSEAARTEGQRRVQETFSSAVILEKYHELYRAVTRGRVRGCDASPTS